MLGQARSLEADDAGLVAVNATQPAPRLLVIDDDNLHRMIICRVAAKAGYVPAGAASYEEAATLAQEATFDCITLDLSLGQHGGVEMLRHLWVIGCKAPIIIISGCDDSTCRETVRIAKSLNLNVSESVPKPVDLAMLRHSLERLRIQRDNAAQRANGSQ
jgi:two-component system, chemotaxis family, chemotaxis protein CheY